MPRRSVRNVFLLGVLVGLVVALVRAASRDTRPAPARPLATPPAPLPQPTPTPAPVVVAEPEPATEPAPAPDPVVVEEAAPVPAPPVEEVVEVPVPLTETPPVAAPAEAAWVEPVDGACPDGHPIKLKLSSGIFHSPGGLSYERTVPDRCYRDVEAAEADGFRAAKR